jgi:hypothetical protein
MLCNQWLMLASNREGFYKLKHLYLIFPELLCNKSSVVYLQKLFLPFDFIIYLYLSHSLANQIK